MRHNKPYQSTGRVQSVGFSPSQGRTPTWKVATGFAASGTCGRQRAGREHITVSSVDTAFPILPGTRSVVTLMARADISAAFLRPPSPPSRRTLPLSTQEPALFHEFRGSLTVAVVLDRGARDDWLESHFITSFLVIAVVAIALAMWWEWRHDDPVVELTLLRERNFALANVYYFLFAFGLFGSTVLIPEMLQTLFGYTATDAGLVLGPGAAVITLLTPVVVRLVPKIGAARLLGFSFTMAGLALWHYSSFTPQTDYGHLMLARCLQGFGYAFMLVPVSQLAYSYLPKNKNNKGSSLTNLCRNWGGSFGIAFVTTMLERRTQYHQNGLVSHLTSAPRTLREG